MSQDLHALTLTQIAAGLKAGDFSAHDLTEALLGRITAFSEPLNAFITITAEQALVAAKQADEARASGQCGPIERAAAGP